MKFGLLKKVALFGVIAAAMSLSQAKASISVTLVGVGGGPGAYTYDYAVSTALNDLLRTGDTFTIQGIHGYVSATDLGGFSLTAAVTTLGVTTLEYTYSGANQSGPVNISPFVVTSTVGTIGSGLYTGSTSTQQFNGSILPSASIGDVLVPLAVGRAIPEPSSMVLAGLGLAGLAGYGLRRRV